MAILTCFLLFVHSLHQEPMACAIAEACLGALNGPPTTRCRAEYTGERAPFY